MVKILTLSTVQDNKACRILSCRELVVDTVAVLIIGYRDTHNQRKSPTANSGLKCN